MDDTEDIHGILSFRQYDQHLAGSLTIPAGSIKYGNSTTQLGVDEVGNLFVFVGEDEELYRTSGTVDIVVFHVTFFKDTQPSNTFFPILVTLEGIDILSMASHHINTFSSIHSTPSLIVTSRR